LEREEKDAGVRVKETENERTRERKVRFLFGEYIGVY